MSGEMSAEERQWRERKRVFTLRETCPARSCMAKKGQPCVNRSGHPVPYFHVARQDKAYKTMNIAFPV